VTASPWWFVPFNETRPAKPVSVVVGNVPTSPVIVVGPVELVIPDPARTAKLSAAPKGTGKVAASGRADASKDIPANERDITRMIEIVRNFRLCILFGLPPKISNQGLKYRPIVLKVKLA
jgi:hypothetical protein